MPHHHGLLKLLNFLEAACAKGSRHEQTFGRLFAPTDDTVDRDKLATLAQSMDEGPAPDPAGDADLPAGYIFLGQFIDHDITLDVVSSLGKEASPNQIRNLRTPRLELDNVYGDGPEAEPFQYDTNREGYLLIGNETNPDDLPRNSQGVALIGDPRNDENGIVSQLQLLFLRFHNAVLSQVEKGRIEDNIGEEESSFDKARRIVRWHYQWIVRNEFLPAVVSKGVLRQAEADVFGRGQHYHKPVDWESAPLIPVEFSVAAYRFGHSQIRSRYTINPGRHEVDLFQPPSSGLTSFDPVPPEHVVDWDFFFGVDGSRPQIARKIDTLMAHELFALPFVSNPDAVASGENSLAFRNLLRGSTTFNLPPGEEVAKKLETKPIPKHKKVKEAGLDQTPLWFYCLAEAEQNGGKLGEVGGRIVAMTLLRLLKNDESAYVHQKNWTPTLVEGDDFGMADMVKYVRRYNVQRH